MSKCIGFERDAHMTKTFKLQPGDIITPRYVQLASEGRIVFADQREIEREALRKANIAIERRERAQERESAFWGWVKKIIG